MLRMVVVTALLLLIGCQSKPHDYLNESNPLAFAVHLYAQVLVNSCTSHDFEKFAEHVMTENLFKNLIAVQKIEAEEGIFYVENKSLTSLHAMLVSCLDGEQRAEFY